MSEIKIRGLSLAQEKAANLMATGNKKFDDKSIAKAVGVKPSMIKTWKSDPKFRVRVLQLFDLNVDLEKTYRAKRIQKVLKPIYKEINNRLKDPEFFENTSFKELLRMMSQLHAELRIDGSVDKRFLSDAINTYGTEVNSEEDFDSMDEIELDNDMASMSSVYEQVRAEAVGKKKVVNIR